MYGGGSPRPDEGSRSNTSGWRLDVSVTEQEYHARHRARSWPSGPERYRFCRGEPRARAVSRVAPGEPRARGAILASGGLVSSAQQTVGIPTAPALLQTDRLP